MPSNITNIVYKADGGGRNQSSELVYDPKTGTWVPPSYSETSPPTQTNPSDIPNSSTGNNSSTQVDSKKSADKEYIETEFNTLVGDLVVTPSKKSVPIKVNDTIYISGIGKYLSGKYFVSSVKRTLSRDTGYSHTLTVIKNGFGDSLKQSFTEKDENVDREEVVEKSAPPISVGDTVNIVGDAVYSNASEGVKVPAWVKTKTLTVKQVSSDGSRVLLMPINSWTYIKYVQKA